MRSPDIGIVHLGVGAFHRAHQADYTDAVLAKGDLRWGIIGASLRSPDTRDALTPQDYLYTLAESDEAGERCRVIGALRGVLVAPENPQALIEAMCLPSVKIVSLTVTEKGYCHDPATGELNEQHPDIIHDLANPDAPALAPRASSSRRCAPARRAGFAPFTVLCCDNLPANGRTVAKVVTRLAQLRRPRTRALRRGATSPSPPPWWTASCPPRPTPTAPASPPRPGSRTLARRHRGLHQLGDRGPFPAGPPGTGPRTFVTDIAPFETDEAAAAQRRAFLHVLSRLSRGPRDHRRLHAATRRSRISSRI